MIANIVNMYIDKREKLNAAVELIIHQSNVITELRREIKRLKGELV